MMQRKTLVTLAAALISACALPAFAQDTPAQTNLDKSAAHKETRNARGSQLTDVTPEQARANELRRCDNLPPFYKSDCVARVNGQGDTKVQGSVAGGGLFMETKTTITASELKQIQSDPSQTQLQTPSATEPQAAPRKVGHKHKAHRAAKKPAPASAAEPAQPQP